MKPIERVRAQKKLWCQNQWAEKKHEIATAALQQQRADYLAWRELRPLPVLPKSLFQKFKELFT